jgi:hypothetical protein
VAPSFAMKFCYAHHFSILCLFHVFRDELKATVLAWCPEDDSVTHKYFVEMRRLTRDETPFLSVVKLRATTLAWWLDDGNFILLDTHDHDRTTSYDTSYPPTNPLGILLIILVGPPILTDKRFNSFLGDPWAKHMAVLYIGFYLLPNNNPFGPSAPSSQIMRDKPILGQYTQKYQEIRKHGVYVMKKL